MVKLAFSTKRLQIDKANSAVVIATAVAVFIAVFSLFASKALLSKRSYQGRVIDGKEKAVKQLKDNLVARDGLVSAYKQFVEAPTNILGGNPNGTGEKDGDNARLILDALPSKYDYPALASSLEKILTDKSFVFKSITGSDDEIVQQKNPSSPEPEVVDMPFEITVGSTYNAAPSLILLFENSIRPFQIQKLSLSGTNADLATVIKAKTFYLPEKNLNIGTKVVK
ncbi:hypothetical protein HY003_00730 [Candidatus Saccharibacteria bacterium]|nr:hypothetical protein [Candidatus Saccharibacteria bacterium]MBI3337807.1 hypothetical protein [Candidatus Saccharibacteria bacterium]